MQILGLKQKNINILTEEEIINKGKERFNLNKTFFKKDAYEQIANKENWERLQKEPMPYKLFRLNELFNFSLNFVGCEISQLAFMDRLEALPPIEFEYDIYKGYIVNECITQNRYEHIFKHNNKYYCVLMDIQKRRV